MNTREKTLLVMVTILLLVSGTTLWKYMSLSRDYSYAREFMRSRSCKNNLRCMGAVIDLYADYHEGRTFPSTISGLASEEYGWKPGLLCPTRRGEFATPPVGKDIEEWSDYLYVSWTDGKDTPEHYPLLYDRRLANHDGEGIWILLVGGVGPTKESLPPIWDHGAHWLRRFSDTHPEYKIPLPEDLE